MLRRGRAAGALPEPFLLFDAAMLAFLLKRIARFPLTTKFSYVM
jgi:hypothetical protein